MPCEYREYRRAGDETTSTSADTTEIDFSLWANSDDTFIESEVLLYPWTSLVAEFGGTLGLFLGFSFMTLWDGVEWVWVGMKAVHSGKKINIQQK